MKIAQFKTSIKTIGIFEEQDGEGCVKHCGWGRLTEYIEVEFAPLSVDVVLGEQLKQLDAVEAELRNRFQEKLNELCSERAKLLSLTHETP